MPAITPVNGVTPDRFQAVGRTVYQYLIAATGLNTTPYAVGSNFSKIIRAMQQYGTIEMIGQVGKDGAGGTAATSCVVFMSGNEVGVHPLDADLTAVKTGASNDVTLTLTQTYTYQGTAA
jgi:hypothetical protein